MKSLLSSIVNRVDEHSSPCQQWLTSIAIDGAHEACSRNEFNIVYYQCSRCLLNGSTMNTAKAIQYHLVSFIIVQETRVE